MTQDEPQEVPELLTFIRENQNLRQIVRREPQDGFYPPVKKLKDFTPNDVPRLVKEKQFG